MNSEHDSVSDRQTTVGPLSLVPEVSRSMAFGPKLKTPPSAALEAPGQAPAVPSSKMAGT